MAKESVTLPVKLLHHLVLNVLQKKKWVSTCHFWDFTHSWRRLKSDTTETKQGCEIFYLTSEAVHKESLIKQKA